MSGALYQLTLNDTQAALIAHALDFWGRLRAGQFNELRACIAPGADLPSAEDAIAHLRRALRPDLAPGASDMSFTGGPLSFNLRKVLEHAISWTNQPEGGLTVNFDGPLGSWWEGQAPAVLLRFEGDEAVRVRDRANREIRLIGKLAEVLGTDDVEDGIALIKRWKEAAMAGQVQP